MSTLRVSHQQWQVISAVTFGNILEWFEIYLFVYWAPVFSKIFFGFNSELINLTSIFILFGVGFISRPIGAIFFGRLGDLVGRKRAFVLSILVMTIPTFMMGLLPTYQQVGMWAPVFMGILRILQACPSGGESPGAFCYLYENSGPGNRRFITSWGGFGNQVGAILSLGESIIMESIASEEFLLSWGWRISFFSGGIIGLMGVYLRRKLHETPVFLHYHKIHYGSKQKLSQILSRYRVNIGLGIIYGIVNAATFYLLASYLPSYLQVILLVDRQYEIAITLSVLLLTTLLLPLFGYFGDKYNFKKLLIFASIAIILLSATIYLSILYSWNTSLLISSFLIIFPITYITAVIPYLLTHIFPTSVRFTGVGLSFNLADGLVGGFTPAITLLLQQYTGQSGVFTWLIAVCALISLLGYARIKYPPLEPA
jgi:MFS family permease